LADSFTRSSLADGVNLYVQTTSKFKTTAVYVYFHLPLSDDMVTKNALLPMVLARGSEDYPTTADLARHFDDLYGATFGVDIGRRGEVHSLVFRIEVPGDQHLPVKEHLLEKAMETLAGLILRPAREGDGLKSDYFKQEVKNLRQAIEGLINEKRSWAMVRCTQAMCKGEPFSLYRLGRVEDLPAITPQSLLAHHQRMLEAAPVDIFVVGDVELETARDLVRRTLRLPKAAPSGRLMPTTMVKLEPGRPVERVTDRLDVNQGVLVIGMRTGSTVLDDGYFPMMVANAILGGFPHSKLFQEVRERNSLAYFCYSSLETVKGVGFMYAGIEFDNMERCQEIMLEQLKAVQNGEIDEDEFNTTIGTLVNDMLGSADSQGAMADLAVDRVFSGRDLSIEDRVAAYQKVTIDEVAAAARRFSVDTVYFLGKSEGGSDRG